MKDQHSSEREHSAWLSPEDQARIAAFKAYSVTHPLLDEADSALTRAILEPAGFAHVLVYGPSGVGKTRMLERVESRLQDLYPSMMPATGTSGSRRELYQQGNLPVASHPLLVLEARPPDGFTFNRADYYRAALMQLDEPFYRQWSLVDIQAGQTWETKTRSKGRSKEAHFNDAPELRHALEEAMARRGVCAVIVDEAQHLMHVSSGTKLLDQLNWIKSMTNVTGVLHVLVGTYDLLDFRNLNGQTARRGHDIHFPRYQFQHEADRKAFQGVLHTLLTQIPLEMDIQDLMNHWFYFYERSIGCVGVLKDWLIRTVAGTLRSNMRTVTLAHLQTYALLNAQCESMATDAKMAEQKLHYTESSRERLWSLLGMSVIPVDESKPSLDASTNSVSPSGTLEEVSPKMHKRRVGQRSPGRDSVGEAKIEEKTLKCPFVGTIELTPDQISQAGISKLQCPECGAMWTARIRGKAVFFPAHPPRVTSTVRDIPRWMKRGEVWALAEKQVELSPEDEEKAK